MIDFDNVRMADVERRGKSDRYRHRMDFDIVGIADVKVIRTALQS